MPEIDNPAHQGVSFSACLHGLFGKNASSWDSYNKELSKTIKPLKYQFGQYLWEGSNKETIAIKCPSNQHYHGGEFLSKYVYQCGHAKKPEAPYLIVGACIKERPISAMDKNGGKKPFIAVLESPNQLGFYWLDSRGEWEKTDEIKLPDYSFDNMISFSSDTTHAVSLVSKTTIYKIIGNQFDDLNSPLKVPYLITINILNNGKVSYNIDLTSASLQISNIANLMLKININCTLAISFIKNTIKNIRGSFEILGFKSEYFSAISMPSTTFNTNTYYVYFCCDTGKHCLTGMHWSNYYTEHPAPSVEVYPITLGGYTGIKGDFLSWKQQINGVEQKEITGSIVAVAEYEYGTAQWDITWWNVWALANCDFKTLNPYIREEVDGLLRNRYLYTLFGYSPFGSKIALYSSSDLGESTFKSQMQTLSPLGCVISPVNEGVYVENDGYLEANIPAQFNQKGSIYDRYKPRTYPANESRRELIVVIDLNNNLLITHNNQSIFIKKIINENSVEIIQTIPLLNLSMAMTYEKVGFYQFDYGICGLFSTENIKYVSNNKGDYLLQLPNHKAILNGRILDVNYLDLGVS